MNLNSASSAGPSWASAAGSSFGADWNVSTGGGSAGGLPAWVLYAAAAGVVWWLWKRRAR